MTHVDKLEYGWWERKRGNVLLPTTIGQKNNFVLYPAELAEYVEILGEFKALADKAYEQARFTAKTLENGRIPSFDNRTPTLYTVAHLLQSCVDEAKIRLRLMKFLHGVTKRRVDLKKETVDESPSKA
jgi:hypothetical protein